MATFDPAYKIIRVNEGYYSNRAGDKGGETYAGVARNPGYHPDWNGWPTLDAYKLKIGRALKNNEQVPGMEPFVYSFYNAWWNTLGLSALKSQDAANLIYDFIVNSGSTGTLETETVLQNIFKANIKADRTFDQTTINLINAQDPAKFVNALLAERKRFYNSLAVKLYNYVVQPGDTIASIAKTYNLSASDIPSPIKTGQTISIPTQKQFLNGWLSRLNIFPTLTTTQVVGGTGILVAIGIGIFFLVKTRLNHG